MGTSHLQLQHDGLTRSATLFTPTNATQPAPLVICFHGGGSHPEGVRQSSRFDEVASSNGFCVLYPGGTDRAGRPAAAKLLWNDGRPWQNGSPSTIDDVGFVRALLDSGQFAYDPSRVYAAGYSNGAQFVFRLAQQLSDRIAAVAAVAGQRGPSELFGIPPRPISIMQFSGVKDRIAPYNGGGPPRFIRPPFVTNLPLAQAAVSEWAHFNGCGPASVRHVGQATEAKYQPAADGTEVIFWTLANGGHTWPGGNSESWVLGPVNRDVLAASEMWRMFSRHRLK